MAFQKSAQNPRQEAEARLAFRQQKADEAKRALNEYEAAARAIDANTARLRALRLAKEAADAAANSAARAEPAGKRKSAKR